MDDELPWFRSCPPTSAPGSSLVAQAGIAVLRRVAALARRRAAADRRGVRRRAAGDGPLGHPAADRRARANHDHGRRGAPAAPRRAGHRGRRARGVAPLQPRDRVRVRARLRQRRGEPRARGTPGSRRWSSTAWCAASRSSTSRRASWPRSAGARPDRSTAVVGVRAGSRARGDAVGRAPCRAPARASTRWPASTAAGWSSSSATSTTRVVAATGLLPSFGDGPVVVGPRAQRRQRREHRSPARRCPGCARSPGWPGAPRPVSADALLPERALAGDADAREALVDARVPAADRGRRRAARHGDARSSTPAAALETTARALFVHANTVRYRLRRVAEVCGETPTDPRGAFTIQVALALGRLEDARPERRLSIGNCRRPGDATWCTIVTPRARNPCVTCTPIAFTNGQARSRSCEISYNGAPINPVRVVLAC